MVQYAKLLADQGSFVSAYNYLTNDETVTTADPYRSSTSTTIQTKKTRRSIQTISTTLATVA